MDLDASTLSGKLIMGYQGWFGCPNDGSQPNRWWHWFRDGSSPDALNLTVDLWPDSSDIARNQLFQTNMKYSNGEAASLYSAYNSSIVDMHFKWMQDYNLDGIILQRFVNELGDAQFKDFRDKVTRNVKASAEKYERVFCIMYDITGYIGNSMVADIMKDWADLVNRFEITQSKCYLNHKGNPLLAVWGLGFQPANEHPGTPAESVTLIGYLKKNKVTVLGGVPYNWRTLDQDSQTEPEWRQVYRSFDVISPWSVGRYNASGADRVQQNHITLDLSNLLDSDIDYMPVIFPGFSFYNKARAPQNHPLNEIPRNGGMFWWRQFYNAVNTKCKMVYGAMFDEVDEGTAMFKLVTRRENLPTEAQDRLLYLNIDGKNIPSDWYLRLAGRGGKVLRGEIPLATTMPDLDKF